MDWDRIKKNVKRSGTFVGNGLQDEDAYYDFFADDIDCFPAKKHRRGSVTLWAIYVLSRRGIT